MWHLNDFQWIIFNMFWSSFVFSWSLYSPQSAVVCAVCVFIVLLFIFPNILLGLKWCMTPDLMVWSLIFNSPLHLIRYWIFLRNLLMTVSLSVQGICPSEWSDNAYARQHWRLHRLLLVVAPRSKCWGYVSTRPSSSSS